MYKNMLKQQRISNLQSNQQGIVAIIVVMLLMIVLTLIVLSFAKVSRRENRNAFDRQLSTQAFYAAESGINDAKKIVEGWLASDPSGHLGHDYVTDCIGANSFADAAGLTLPAPLTPGSSASYTCLFVDASPQSISFSASPSQQVFPLEARGGSITSVEIYWDDGSSNNDFSSCPGINSNPTVLSNCDAPVMRVQLVNDADISDPNGGKSFFIYPGGGPGTLNYSDSSTGAAATGTCTAGGSPNRCKIAINNMPPGKYFARLNGIYKPLATNITANNGTAELIGAQILIDSTGRAADVERRIQVRVKANNLSQVGPGYALEGTDRICKKFSIDGGSNAFDNGRCATGLFPD